MLTKSDTEYRIDMKTKSVNQGKDGPGTILTAIAVTSIFYHKILDLEHILALKTYEYSKSMFVEE